MSFIKDYQQMAKDTTRDVKRNFKPLMWLIVFVVLTLVVIWIAYSLVWNFQHFLSSSQEQARQVNINPTVTALQVKATANALVNSQLANNDQATAQAAANQNAISQSQATAQAVENEQSQQEAAATRTESDAPFWDTFGKLAVVSIFALVVMLVVVAAGLWILRESHWRKTGLVEIYKLKPDANGNYEAYFTPEKQLVRPEPGNVIQPVPTHYSPNFSRSIQYAPHTILKNDLLSQALPPAINTVNNNAVVNPVELEIPGPIDFAEILASFRPEPDKIFLALGKGAEHRTVPANRLFNIALSGATRQGKTNIMRLVLAQLLHCGAIIYLTDPKYTDFDLPANEDWRPIRDKLAQPPAYLIDDIKNIISWITLEEIPRRLELRRQGKHYGQPLFLAMDELPWIVKKWPEATDHISEILRIGSGLGVMVVGSAQDFLVSTIGGSGAVRDCYRTAYYVGGDDTTGRVLLDMKGQKGPVDDGTLGRGVALLRSDGKSAEKVRIPFMSNAALYSLLGKPETPIVEKDTAHEPSNEASEVPDSPIFETTSGGSDEAAKETMPEQIIIITSLPAGADSMTARARSCYRPGISISQLAQAAGCSETTAANVIREMKRKQQNDEVQ